MKNIPMKKKSTKSQLTPLIAYSGTFLGILLAFWSVQNLNFLSWDDNVYVYENPLIRNLTWTGIQDIFRNFVMGNYHPLVILSYAIEFSIAGIEPKLYHLTNLALHIGTTLLALRVIHQLTQNLPMALLAALFFGLHPLKVESVAWVTERKDVLYGFFYLASLSFWLLYRESGKMKDIIVMMALFILSCLSKGQAVTLPLAIILIELFLGSKPKELFKNIPLLSSILLSLVFGIIAIYAQKSGGNIRSSEAFNIGEQLLLGCGSLLFYLPKFIFPYPLVPFYPYPEAPLSGIWYLSLAGITLLLYILLASWKKEKIIFFGLSFYLIHLLPVAQFLPVGNAIAADRYFYLPGLGLGLLVAWVIATKLKERIALLTGVGIAIFWGILSYQQIGIWKNTETFFTHIIKKDPSVDFAFVNLGRYLEKQNRKREAADVYIKGIQENPDYPDQYNDGGYTLSHLGKYDSAKILLTQAIQLAPEMAEAYNNMGYNFSMMQQFDSSELYLTKSIKLNPKNETAFNNLGSTYSMMGKYTEAIQSFEEAIRLKPEYADAYNNEGSSYGMMGNNTKALELFQKAIALNPNFGGAWFNAGIALQSMGNKDQAVESYKKAARLGHAPAIDFLKSQGIGW